MSVRRATGIYQQPNGRWVVRIGRKVTRRQPPP